MAKLKYLSPLFPYSFFILSDLKVASLLLLEKECKPDVLGKNNLTPLHVAVHCNHPEVATLLLDHGASPHSAAKVSFGKTSSLALLLTLSKAFIHGAAGKAHQNQKKPLFPGHQSTI